MTARRALVVPVAVALLSSGCGADGPGRTAATTPPVGVSDRAAPVPPDEAALRVRVDLLAGERGRMDAAPGSLARNPFRFGFSNRQPAPPSPPWPDAAGDWGDPPPLDPLTWPDSAGDVWSNPTPLVLIGVIEAPASAGRVAVLTDGEAVYHGRVGDVLGAYARIVAITPPSIELEPAAGARYTLHMAR